MLFRSKVWLRYARRPELLERTGTELDEGYRMFSEHFIATDFMDPGKTRLTKTAVPTVRQQTCRTFKATGNIMPHLQYLLCFTVMFCF